MSKRILSLVLALVMVLGTFGTVFAAETAAVTVEKDAAKFLSEAKILKGDDKGNLNLDLKLERRDMVILLSRLMGEEEVAAKFPVTKDSPSWTDVRTDAYYVSFLAWAQVNKIFNGNTDKEFAPRSAITAQDYSVVLLRALGYDMDGHDAWKTALADAKKLGVLADVVVEDATQITRGQMSVMTLNALAVKVKDSTKTLAEELGIKLPVPAVLEVEEVAADNLKEIKVVFNKSVDEESAVDVNNYETNAGDIADINYSADNNTVVILLDKAMKNKGKYELTIDGIKDISSVKKEFVALDNAIPTVVEVVALGTKAVKVVMSEPIDGAKASNFKVDGKSTYGSVEVAAGRDIILKTYSNVSIGEHEVTVSGLKDFAGFKSVETAHSFTVEEDKDAPTIAEVKATLEKVVVTFSEDVDTVSKNNVYWKNGSTKNYADDAKRLAGNKFEFTFNGSKGLPVHETTLYVEGVKDYSGNKMTSTEVAVKASIDETRPVVRKVEVKDGGKKIVVTFSKSVNVDTAKDEKGSAVRIDNYKVTDSDDNKVTISEITNPKKDNKTFEIELGKALSSSKDYTLKVSGIKDNNKYSNYMVDYSEKLSATEYNAPTLKNVSIGTNKDNGDERKVEVTLYFDKAMDLGTLADPANYLIATKKDGASDDTATNKVLSKFEDYDIDVKDSNGKIVVLTVVTDKSDKLVVVGIAGLGLKGANEKELTNYGQIVKHNAVKFALKADGAKATKKDKIVLTFTQEVKEAPASAFSVGKVGIKDVTISGDTVTIMLSQDLKADASNGLTIDKDGVLAYDGSELTGETSAIVLKDEIAPSIISADAKRDGTIVKLTVTFDEDLKANANWADDLTVTAINGGKDVTFGTEVPANDEKLVLTVDLKEDTFKDLDKTAFEVKVKDARYIVDVNKNEAADSSERTNAIDGIKGAVSNSGKETAKANLADAINAANVTLQTATSGALVGNYAPTDIAKLEVAIEAAEVVHVNETATETELVKAKTTLVAAEKAFKDSVIVAKATTIDLTIVGPEVAAPGVAKATAIVKDQAGVAMVEQPKVTFTSLTNGVTINQLGEIVIDSSVNAGTVVVITATVQGLNTVSATFTTIA